MDECLTVCIQLPPWCYCMPHSQYDTFHTVRRFLGSPTLSQIAQEATQTSFDSYTDMETTRVEENSSMDDK
jgi:hypothetical protein